MRYLIVGESHRLRLIAIIEGVPAELPLTTEDINVGLERCRGDYGHDRRMKIESNKVEITSGVRHGKATGAPITPYVINKDYEKWLNIMAVENTDDSLKTERKITHPRPGHADLVGGMRYRFGDLRNSPKRSSARETTMRIAVGVVAKHILAELDIEIASHVVIFGGKEVDVPEGLAVSQIKELASQSGVPIVSQEREQKARDYIDRIRKNGNTIDGVVGTAVDGVLVGLGSYVQQNKKLDVRIVGTIASINAFEGTESGLGFRDGYLKGSQVMGEILWNEEDGYTRHANNLGGSEGGMTNGQPTVARGVMEPIPTLHKPLMLVDIKTHEPYRATVGRSDPMALPIAGVAMEAVAAAIVTDEILEKFSSDNLEELKEVVARHRDYVKHF